ncbi:MAG: response regulator transcription factor [Gammaproteobacteria bacterium]|nr:response regulator transcription factor [Gammaproteobacteria bacterium]MCB1926352.1 response regulator transcription factor [Gammaproteobacteria bacterium]
MKTRIMIVDDHKIVREGLRKLIEDDGSFQVVGEAGNGRDGIRLARQLQPQIVIMDVAMHEMNGIEATRQLLANQPDVRVLALSMHSDSRFVKQMLEAGALGYLLKDDAFEEIVTALRSLVVGRMYVSPQASGGILQDLAMGQVSAGQDGSPLTAREKETLQLIAEGHSTAEIAERLFVSVKTVETHRKKIMDKLDMHSIAELTKYAIREGITSLDD